MRRNFRIGPGAASLMLVIVVVAMSLLALLTFIEVHGDHKLTCRCIDFSVAEYEASSAAEYVLAELDGILAVCAAESEDDAGYLATKSFNSLISCCWRLYAASSWAFFTAYTSSNLL